MKRERKKNQKGISEQGNILLIGKNSNCGITLVALVVAIVALLILAGITIVYVFGDNGVLKLAKDSGDKTKEATQNEKDGLDKMNYWVEKGGLNGKVELVKSKDGIIVPVPKDFKPSNADGENTVEDGFVIYQGTEEVNNDNVEEARKTRNQFVWVPVENPSSMYGERVNPHFNNFVIGDNYLLGKLYDISISEDGVPSRTLVNITEENGKYSLITDTLFGEPLHVCSSIKSVRPPSELETPMKEILGLPDLGGEYGVTKAWMNQLCKEFKMAMESVEKYNGFYIGRYETGNLSEEKVVVRKENSDLGGLDWFTLYKKSKEITDGKYSSTTIIWGSMWDATIWWIACQGENKLEYIKNSSKYGNIPEKAYQINQNVEYIPTGSNELYKFNNIYDMVGNKWEATMEVSTFQLTNTRGQVLRRG